MTDNKTNRTELVLILDRSGSMSGLEKDTIGGYNAMLEKQKKEPGEATVTTVLFDNYVELLHDRIPIQGVAPITEKEYYVRGCTALLDAIGMAIQKISAVQQYTSPEMRAEKVSLSSPPTATKMPAGSTATRRSRHWWRRRRPRKAGNFCSWAPTSTPSPPPPASVSPPTVPPTTTLTARVPPSILKLSLRPPLISVAAGPWMAGRSPLRGNYWAAGPTGRKPQYCPPKA